MNLTDSKHCIFLCILCLFFQASAKEIQWEQKAPGGFSIRVEIPNNEIGLLDTLEVIVTAIHPQDYQLDWNAVKSHLLLNIGFSDTPFQLVSEKLNPVKTDAQGQMIETGIFRLTPLQSGKQILTLLKIPFVGKDPHKQKPVEFISPLFEIEIALPPQQPEKKLLQAPLLTFEEAFPVDANGSNRIALEEQDNAKWNVFVIKEREIPWIGMIGLAAAFALLLTAKKTVKPAQIIPQISIKQQALADLQKAHTLLEEKSYDAYYTALSQILRHYIETTYQVPADARTTEEFLKEMAEHPIFPKETQAALKAFLQNADHVRYGHLPAKETEAAEAYKLATDLINS